MTKIPTLQRLETGVRNLDAIFDGGLPRGSVSVIAGPPGSGKTVLAHQICFHDASPRSQVLHFSTLSEPSAKTLKYLAQFSFFDPKKLGTSVHFVDLGAVLRGEGLESTAKLIMQHVKRVKPAIVVIDSFKVFDDLARSREELRRFSYEIAVNLMAWEATVLLLGEYATPHVESTPLFSIVDGLFLLSQREAAGEHQRFFRIVKMRGTNHSRDEHPFVITPAGLEVFAPRVAIRRAPTASGPLARCTTNIPRLDELLGPGIPWGSSLLVCGVAGTGKTVLSLEFLYRGAVAGEKGIMFSFEETEERLRATARGLGWDLEREIERGMVEIVFIPQPEIHVESHILMIQERVEALDAKRVVIDSVSVFLHKVKDPQLNRERIFHLCSIIQNAQAVGFFSTDIPYGTTQISRFGVEETVVDGVILLTSTEEDLERQRYVEVYKLRNTAHLKGRHNMVIGPGGVSIFPRYGDDPNPDSPPPSLEVGRRVSSGVPGLDDLMGGGLLERSVTLVSGSAGIGKSTLATQFLLAGAEDGAPGLFVTLEEGPEQLVSSADAVGLPLRAAVDAGTIQLLYLSREHIRAGQFLTVLSERVQALQARRIALDATTHMAAEGMSQDAFRHLLYRLAVRFKTLGVTTLLTLESSSLFATDAVTDRGLSPVADNLLLLRYTKSEGQLAPMLMIVKTRGSAHDLRTHPITTGAGGVRVGPRPNEPSVAEPAARTKNKLTKKKTTKKKRPSKR